MMLRRQRPDGFYAYPDHAPMWPAGWARRLLWKLGFDPLTGYERLRQTDREREYWKAQIDSPPSQSWPASDPLESAWGIIANAYGGNWSEATNEWRTAAERWRDEVWHASLDRHNASSSTTERMKDIGLRYFQERSRQRAMEWHQDAPWSLSDWMTALAGEMGEAANVIKKLNRHRDGIAAVGDPSEADLYAELAMELADTLSYLVLVADHAGVDLAAAAVDKFNAVSERQGWDHHRISPLPGPVPEGDAKR